ncbi:MAG: phytanoyl-CoA dioxygenase family protein [Acidimicrobiales bacterium]
MIRRVGHNLAVREDRPEAAARLEEHGWLLLPGAIDAALLRELADELTSLYSEGVGGDAVDADAGGGADARDTARYRYQACNRSDAAQRALALPAVLAAIEPLLGEDCHVIANTVWRDPPGFEGGPWHCDAGPHVPRPPGVAWPDDIPYPVFAVGAHLYLTPCRLDDGPTAVVPGSHRSGRLPPRPPDGADVDLDWAPTFEGRGPVVVEADAGDVVLFVSDVWHRGTPARPGGRGRFFLQAHYGRRDIAQRLVPTASSHQLSDAAVERARASGPRHERLVGLHPRHFYDG